VVLIVLCEKAGGRRTGGHGDHNKALPWAAKALHITAETHTNVVFIEK